MARIVRKLLSDSTGGMMLRVLLILTMLLVSPLVLAAERVVSLGGTVTEIVYAIGKGDTLVADDASSLYPEQARKLPSVGYYRSLSLEGVLSRKPELLLASENAGPPEVLDRLRTMGVHTVAVSDAPGIDSLFLRVEQIAAALDASEAGEALQAHIRASLNEAREIPATARRALIVLHRGGPLMSAGSDTSAHALLELAGMHNAAAGTRGYKPLSAEALVKLAPDMIITTTMSAENAGGMAAFSAHPGIAATPAAKAGRVLAVDDLLLLGMGPRVAEAVAQLRHASL